MVEGGERERCRRQEKEGEGKVLRIVHYYNSCDTYVSSNLINVIVMNLIFVQFSIPMHNKYG